MPSNCLGSSHLRLPRARDVPARPPLATAVVSAIAALKLVLHVVVNLTTPYGVHRDEFLYLAMGEHLRWWRMDFPPFVAALAHAERAVTGDSLASIRLAPAVAGALLVVLAAVLARELGGRRFAQALAALAVLASPLFLRSSNLFQPVVFDQLWWTLGLYALVRLQRTGRPRWWLALGAVGGLGLLTKFSIAFFAFGVLVALLATPERRALATGWPWAAVAVALAIGAPSVVGQIQLGYPALGYMSDLQETQLARVSATEFLLGQVLLGPAVALAALGLVYLLGATVTRHWRIVGWTCLAAFVTLLVLRGKAYYVGPVYPTLFAAGAAALEQLAGRAAPAVRGAVVALVLAYGAIALPFGVPILPPALMASYAARTGVTSAVTTNRGTVEQLPQDYADMLGWPEQVAAVASVYHALPPAQRVRAVVIAGNYGEAGAIDFYRRAYDLPRAVSAAGSYWFFGPGDKPGDVAVTIGVPRETLLQFFRSARPAARLTNAFAVEEERDLTIYVAEGPYRQLQAVWPELRPGSRE